MFKFSRVFLSVFVLLSLFLTGILGCGGSSSDTSNNPNPSPNPPPSFVPLSYLSECSLEARRIRLLDKGDGFYYEGIREYEDKNCQGKYLETLIFMVIKGGIDGSIEDYVKGKKLVLKSVTNINDSGQFIFISGNISSDTSFPIKYEELSRVCGYKPDGKAYPIYINEECPKLLRLPVTPPPGYTDSESSFSYDESSKTLTMCQDDDPSRCDKFIKE